VPTILVSTRAERKGLTFSRSRHPCH